MLSDPEIAKVIGNVMGIVFSSPNAKSIYVAADSIWFSGIKKAIEKHKPEVIVLNTGKAALTLDAFKDDPYIIMGKEDTLKATKFAPNAQVIAVHMDAINHMTLDRRELSEYVNEQGIRDKVFIPFDGETLIFK